MATESTDVPDDYERATDLEPLREEGRAVANVGGHSVALFHHEGEVYGVDNRCPHMISA